MELNSPRPAYLIKRNMSDTGHLNNIDSSYYLSLIVGNKTKTILFAHLSRDCNREDLVLKAYKDVFLAQKDQYQILKYIACTKICQHLFKQK